MLHNVIATAFNAFRVRHDVTPEALSPSAAGAVASSVQRASSGSIRDATRAPAHEAADVLAHGSAQHAAPGSADQVAHVARVALPSAAMDAPSSEDVMRIAYAQSAHPALPKALWGEIARHSARDDLLALRRVSKDMGAWTDRSLTTLNAHANDAAAMLDVMRKSRDFNHIDAVCIRDCDGRTLPTVLAAFAALPHQKMHLIMITESVSESLQASWPLLRSLSPASMSINFSGADHHTQLSSAESKALAALPYPIFLGVGIYGDDDEDEQDLQALASIRMLCGLDLCVDGFSDEAAQAFKDHHELAYLRVEDYQDVDLVMSTAALTALAESTALKRLHIGNTRDVFGEAALHALSANRTLESLRFGTYDAPFVAAAAQILSTNTTLKRLDMALLDGCGHLAKMPSLEYLTLCAMRTEVTQEDARQFAQHARLKILNFSTEVRIPITGQDLLPGQWRFEAGAFAILASSHVEHLVVPATEWTSDDIDAVLANRALRNLECGVVDDASQMRRHAIVDIARRLAGHPTLESLTITFVSPWSVRGASAYERMTDDERTSIFQAWGAHRIVSQLRLQGFKERELSTQHYRIERLDHVTHVV